VSTSRSFIQKLPHRHRSLKKVDSNGYNVYFLPFSKTIVYIYIYVYYIYIYDSSAGGLRIYFQPDMQYEAHKRSYSLSLFSCAPRED